MEKKSNLITIIIAIIAVIAALCGGYFLGNQKVECKCDVSDCSDNENQSTVGLIDEDKDIVYTKETKEGTADDTEYSYKLAYINIDSKDAKAINEELSNVYQEYVDEIEKDDMLSVSSIDYKYYENGNILSLVVQTALCANDLMGYYVYNIDKTTGIEVNDSALFKEVGISRNDVATKYYQAMQNIFTTLNGDAPSSSSDQYSYYIEASDNNQYISYGRPNYFIKDGKLIVVSDVACMAGAGSYGKIFDLSGNEVEIFDKQ